MPTPMPTIAAIVGTRLLTVVRRATRVTKRQADAEAQRRDDERQSGGDRRAERQQQDDGRCGEADDLRQPLLVDLVRHLPAELDLPAGLGRRSGGTAQLLDGGDLVDRRDRDVVLRVSSAVRPSGLERAGSTALTWSTAAARTATCSSTCGSRRPSAACTTMRAWVPAAPGKRSRSRSVPAWLSVPGIV
jgi:hypothetical protein